MRKEERVLRFKASLNPAPRMFVSSTMALIMVNPIHTKVDRSAIARSRSDSPLNFPRSSSNKKPIAYSAATEKIIAKRNRSLDTGSAQVIKESVLCSWTFAATTALSRIISCLAHVSGVCAPCEIASKSFGRTRLRRERRWLRVRQRSGR